MQPPQATRASPVPSARKGTKLVVAIIVVIITLTLLLSFNFGGNPMGFVADLPTRLVVAGVASLLVAVAFLVLRSERGKAPRT